MVNASESKGGTALSFAAAQGRLRDPSHEGLIAPLLADLLMRGIRPVWAAVRRRFNRDADRLASAAVVQASRRAEDGEVGPLVEVRWHW